MFILISSIVSPEPPPLAASILLDIKDCWQKSDSPTFTPGFGTVFIVPFSVIVFEATLAPNPPPTI